MGAIWIQPWHADAATLDQHLGHGLISALPKELVSAIAIREEQDCPAIARPGSGYIRVLIESQTTGNLKATFLPINLRQENLCEGVHSPQNQPLAISSYAQPADSSHTFGELLWLTLRLSGLLVDTNRPDSKIIEFAAWILPVGI